MNEDPVDEHFVQPGFGKKGPVENCRLSRAGGPVSEITPRRVAAVYDAAAIR
jgi:hypothetical protein